jgi:hypothetical protein
MLCAKIGAPVWHDGLFIAGVFPVNLRQRNFLYRFHAVEVRHLGFAISTFDDFGHIPYGWADQYFKQKLRYQFILLI